MNLLHPLGARLGLPPAAPAISDPGEIDRLYRYWRLRVMYSMTTGYALFYLLRKNLSMAAKPMIDEFGFTNTQWGLMLSVATIVYACSKFLSGVIGDRANPRYLMAGGLLFSALVNVAFGFGAGLGSFVVLWALNNLFQGAGSPPCFRLLTHWFSPKEIGRAWGVWNASHQVGGALIAVGAGWLVTNYGWRSAFWVPAALCTIGAFWLFNRLTDSPEALGLPAVEVYREGAAPTPAVAREESFWGIFREHILTNKWVWIVSVANFFIYIVRIGVLDWAPKYLVEAKGFTLKDAGVSLSVFEIAGIFGAYAAGWISDKLDGRRGPVSVFFMLLLLVSVGLMFFVPSGQRLTMAVLFGALGFFVYGPQMLVAVAAADFATKVASSSAVGLTGLLGYIGASVCGVGTGMLVDRYGWNGAIWLYAGSAFVGCGLLALTWSQTAATTARTRR
jgi:phosphoglycerate transporter family protein